jgi:hypothetical protein
LKDAELTQLMRLSTRRAWLNSLNKVMGCHKAAFFLCKNNLKLILSGL